MSIVKKQTTKRTVGEIIRGLFLLCHPMPVLFHTIAVSLFALMAAWPTFNGTVWRTIIFIVAAHMAMQMSIAVLNDYFDRNLDAASKPDKPLVRGLITPYEALLFGLLLMALMVCLLLPLNPLALLISLLYFVLGQGYNLGLKATPLSGIVFALAIPLIPLYAFAGVGHLLPFVFWLIPVAALLGVALNLANSFPDIEEDTVQHVRTLAVVLGVQGTFILCPLLITFACVLIVALALTRTVVTQSLISIPTLVLTGIAILALYLFFGPARPVQTRKRYFYVVVLTCLLLAGGWLLSILL